jgi:hypothetical protein
MPRDDTERYRQVAEDAVQQFDWWIGQLHGIHKTKISSAACQEPHSRQAQPHARVGGTDADRGHRRNLTHPRAPDS